MNGFHDTANAVATVIYTHSLPAQMAVLWSGLIGIAATWLGILLAYDSFYWPPAQHGWPVSFFVVTLVFVFYLLAQLPAIGRAGGARARQARTGG